MDRFYTCAECGAQVSLPLSVKTVACKRCGDVSMIHEGRLSRFYPSLHMLPVTEPGPVSKWMPSTTRPARAGVYDCRFRHLEPTVVRLRWDGRHFITDDTRRIDMTHFLSWRGVMG